MSLLLIALAPLAQAAPAWTAPELEVVAALTARHQTADCDTLVAQLDTPVASLTRMVQLDTPPWVGLRAATCLLPLQGAEPELRRWLQADDTAGLVDLLVRKADTLPPTLTVPLLREGLDGPHEARLRKGLPQLTTPELRALVTPAR